MSSKKSGFSGEGLPSSRYGERTPLRSLENEMLNLLTSSSRLKSKSLSSTDVEMTKGNVCCDSEPHLNSYPFTEFITNDMTTAETACGLGDVTLKSFICAGGEVEISASSVCAEESIVLPKDQTVQNMCETEDAVTSDNMVMHSCSDHVEHPYFNPDMKDASSVDQLIGATYFSKDPSTTLGSGYLADKCVTQDSGENGSEKPANGLSDLTFKSFNCTGGEIEISDGTRLADETVPLPANHILTSTESNSYDVDPSNLTGDHEVQNGSDHLDHPYCNIESYSSAPNGNSSTSQEQLLCSIEAMDEAKQASFVVADSHIGRQEAVTFGSFNRAGDEIKNPMMKKASPLPQDQSVICQPLENNTVHTSVTQEHIQDDYVQLNCHMGVKLVDSHPSAFSTVSLSNTSLKALNNEFVKCQVQETLKHPIHSEDSALPSVPQETVSSDSSQPVALAGTPTSVEVQQHYLELVPQDFSSSESSKTKDSALGSSGDRPVLCNFAEKLCAENLTDAFKVLSECPSVASALQVGLLTPVMRRISLATLKTPRVPNVDQFFDDSALEGEKSLMAPLNFDPAGLWAEPLDSPLSCPLFNSTAIGHKPQFGPVTEQVEGESGKPCAVSLSEVEKPALDTPLIPDGSLQQQLRQMAEFLILASGKMGLTASSAPVPLPRAIMVSSAQATPVESHSVCVGTTTLKLKDHSVNTSGIFQRKRDFCVVDSCTLTDPLLWNVPPGSLECLPRLELEQRLRSSMIMVEALVQQLAAARAHGYPSMGPAPSDLREKLVQTDHTELSQTTIYRNLYMEAMSRISELELDGSSLQNLIHCMQNMRGTMTSVSSDMDAALSNMKQIGDIVREDHQSLVSHHSQMKCLFEKTKGIQTRMMQKVKDALHQRNDMRMQMEGAFTDKEAALSAMEKLRTHCSTEISKLEKCVGSQQELLAALNQVYPQQVALNQAYSETLNSASDLLSQTIEEQSSLMKELCTARGFLQKTVPMLLKLNERAAAALRERAEHISARDQAVEESEQTKEELNQANLDLQTAREQIGDLNLQVTILTSEMGVLRKKLTEREEERGQLERKVTELSATVSSTLASYAFLEQAFAAETTKLQQSWKDIQQAKDRVNVLEMSLGQSEQRVCELSQALLQSEEQLSQLQTLSQTQRREIQQLQDVCAQLSGVREMNEFLQMENELAREQVAESECLLRANLQGLRERNIQCEDLKGELSQLQLENKGLQEQLETTRSRAGAAQLELREKLVEAGTDITLLHHRLRGLTDELHAALNVQKRETLKDKECQPVHTLEYCQPSSSFVDSIVVALTAEKEEVIKPETPPDPVHSGAPEPHREPLFSETSAFTRITAVTPKKNLDTTFEPEEDERSSVVKLLADLGSTVTELVSALKMVLQRKDAQLEELSNTICGLQGEQQTAKSKHEAEVFELKHQLHHLNSLAEKGNQALQQKALDDKIVTELTAEIQEARELLNKHKTDNNELRKEAVELHRSLQQLKVESQCLREELKKAGGQSAKPAHFMEEKIQLLTEVERLKVGLQEAEQARVKLLERAKRHQMIHQTNQQKSENELQMLNNMINKVRETLLSLPEVVENCEQLQQLVNYIG